VSGHVHVFVTVGTMDNRLVTKCACGEPSPTAAQLEHPVAKARKPRAVVPKPALIQHEALLPGKCNAPDSISRLRCRWAPGHAPGRRSWVTS
jgi:hypothetical protein